MSKPLFVLVAGVNGSGKSTFTHSLKRHYPNLTIIDPDAIAKDMTGSSATIDSVRASAGRQTIERVRAHIHNLSSFLVESTISGRIYLRYAKEAKKAGFRTLLIYMGLETPELSAGRVADRVAAGGHAIPLEDIIRRHPKSLYNLISHIEIFDIAHIYDNSTDRKWVVGYRNGVLVKKAQYIPVWLQKLLSVQQ